MERHHYLFYIIVHHLLLIYESLVPFVTCITKATVVTNSPVEAKDAFSSPSGKKGWRVYDLESGTISFSRDVVFCEEEFPFSSSRSIDSTHQSVDALPIGSHPTLMMIGSCLTYLILVLRFLLLLRTSLFLLFQELRLLLLDRTLPCEKLEVEVLMNENLMSY